MTQVTDPVCGMTLDSATARFKSTYQSQTYYFCSEGDKSQFDANPGRFISKSTGTQRQPEERPEA